MIPSRPNIVLVMTDQQRRDSLHCYGNRFTETPETSRMAANGMCFDTALTPWPVCTPARATAWTGTYPSTHRVIDNLYGVDNAFATHSAVKTTVFDALQSAGYATAHFGKWHLGEAPPPFFDHWEESFNSRQGHWIDGKLDGIYRPDRATDAAIDWIAGRADQDRPFALLLSFYPPHDPYSAPARFCGPIAARACPSPAITPRSARSITTSAGFARRLRRRARRKHRRPLLLRPRRHLLVSPRGRAQVRLP